MSRRISDCLDIMRNVLSLRNLNDPMASFSSLIRSLNDYATFHMGQDIHIIQQKGTYETVINDSTNGIYPIPENLHTDFRMNAFITSEDSSLANDLRIFTDPVEFYGRWREFDFDDVQRAMPQEVLMYGREFVYRPIPEENKNYVVRMFTYEQLEDFDENETSGNQLLSVPYYLRIFAYGGSLNFARDNNYDSDRIREIEKGFHRERRNLLTMTHNQINKIPTPLEF